MLLFFFLFSGCNIRESMSALHLCVCTSHLRMYLGLCVTFGCARVCARKIRACMCVWVTFGCLRMHVCMGFSYSHVCCLQKYVHSKYIQQKEICVTYCISECVCLWYVLLLNMFMTVSYVWITFRSLLSTKPGSVN